MTNQNDNYVKIPRWLFEAMFEYIEKADDQNMWRVKAVAHTYSEKDMKEHGDGLVLNIPENLRDKRS